MPPVPSRDAYGFQIHCDEEQSAARERCAQSSSKQALKWAKYAQKKSLPTGDKLKKLCRKVSLPVHMHVWHQPAGMLWHVVAQAGLRRDTACEGCSSLYSALRHLQA